MLHIEFLTDLGAKVTVDVESADKLLDVQRQYGRLGWTSGEIPAGGYQFPLDNEADFDWSLIGARKWTNPEGEELVMHKGHAYRRRELEAVDSRKMKLPAAVKFSRGAKSTDPEHVREKADGEFEYVTLAIFRGGKRQERYAMPQGQGQRQHAPQPSAAQPARPTAARPQAQAQPAPKAARAPAPEAASEEEIPF
ncbi:single-stranded DNA-binding protein DdrB [Deinococcus xinjiangensis]|uniref:Single-stranded DNA-binding protein DdrB n=1 Tax=Deinococcus xinjiangensis TaxID=457454 RepID=A0ABP9VHM5_9DEIO